mmetsp:Transcript_718/g.1281  ORF Transcript_718/g.1281 Transcript_718/m.1281 type:complete len:242 (-) Transcript_718:802-1527(-)
MAGRRAASLTAFTDENLAMRGTNPSCRAPRVIPDINPQVSILSATCLGACRLSPFCSPDSLISPPNSAMFGEAAAADTSTAAVVDRANVTIAPHCQKMTRSWYAAAETPLESKLFAVRIALKIETFMSKLRSCTAIPPFNRGLILFHFGTRNNCRSCIICFLTSRDRKLNAEKYSEKTVARAAPATPRLSLNIKTGSKTQLIMLASADTFKGVVVSIFPRKAAKPTCLCVCVCVSVCVCIR